MQNCFEVISLSGVFRVKQFDETVTEICINILFGYFCVYFRGDDEAQEKFVNYLKVGPRWLKYRFVFFWIIVFGLWWQRAAYVCANAIHNCWHRCFSKYFLPGRSIYIVHKFEKRLPLDFFFFLIGSCIFKAEYVRTQFQLLVKESLSPVQDCNNNEIYQNSSYFADG
uniref:Uncharacterized protein n=1 Tax=Pelagomonas calceolata TaxID=35677 RepID=A0A7S4A0D0_9STRA